MDFSDKWVCDQCLKVFSQKDLITSFVLSGKGKVELKLCNDCFESLMWLELKPSDFAISE